MFHLRWTSEIGDSALKGEDTGLAVEHTHHPAAGAENPSIVEIHTLLCYNLSLAKPSILVFFYHLIVRRKKKTLRSLILTHIKEYESS